MARTVVIQDKSGAADEQLLRNYDNVLVEREQYEKNIEHHTKLIETTKQRMFLLERLHAISEAKNRMLEPQFEFQKDEEWIGLQREFLKLNNDSERQGMQKEIEKLEKIIENAKTEIARFEAELPALKAEMDKRGVSYE